MSQDDYYDANIPELSPDPLVQAPKLPWDEHMIELQPKIEDSIGLISPGLWSVGSLMLCQKLEEGKDLPPDAVCNWVDDGITYCIRKRATPKTDKVAEGDTENSRHRKFGGNTRGFWSLSPNTFCKVKSWTEGITTEATTIRWLNQNIPSLPTEKVIFDWVDPEWNRTFMITERIHASIYQDAWASLSPTQRYQVAEQVAIYVKKLSEYKSDYLETVDGNALPGVWSLREGREALPFWKKRIEPRVNKEEYKAYIDHLRKRYGVVAEMPFPDEPFALQHMDLAPTNFFVTVPDKSDPDQKPKLVAIIDWEYVGYYPIGKTTTRPRIMRHFMVSTRPFSFKGSDWQHMLSNACRRAGLPFAWEYEKEFIQKSTYRNYPGLPFGWHHSDWYLNIAEGDDYDQRSDEDDVSPDSA
ncbi:hypothetical protein PVAG01_06367 [Phlyctema vagabunda]|uniref:Aminoglycoside phosphotransferase domain-containing protein n=1 Tax=Phlyctema vagabunda TaxID=108571 RepID=A0ABR4PGT0_9HELO